MSAASALLAAASAQETVVCDILEIAPFFYVLSSGALKRKADLLQDSSRGRVANQVPRINPHQVQFGERIFHYQPTPLGAKAVSPVWHANPIPKLSLMPRFNAHKAHCADEGTI